MPTAVPPLDLSEPESEAPSLPPPLSHAYAPQVGGADSRTDSYDEMVDPAGGLRPHWRAFARRLDAMGPATLSERWVEARHLIRENGVSFNVYGDPGGLERPWQLSPIPVLLAPGEFAALADGLG